MFLKTTWCKLSKFCPLFHPLKAITGYCWKIISYLIQFHFLWCHYWCYKLPEVLPEFLRNSRVNRTHPRLSDTRLNGIISIAAVQIYSTQLKLFTEAAVSLWHKLSLGSIHVTCAVHQYTSHMSWLNPKGTHKGNNDVVTSCLSRAHASFIPQTIIYSMS